MPVAVGDHLRAHFTREAEERLRDIIPNKIRQLDDLLKEDMFNLTSGLKKVRASNDKLEAKIAPFLQAYLQNPKIPIPLTIASNDAMEQVYFAVRPFILALIDDAQVLRMWVQLNIPRIEDGNNFGVSVQEEVLMETNKAELDASAMLDFYGDYLMYRAKVASKVCKWPTVPDYQRALSDADEGAFIRMRMNARDVRNHYSRLYDLYEKNGLKIRAPRSESESQINIMY